MNPRKLALAISLFVCSLMLSPEAYALPSLFFVAQAGMHIFQILAFIFLFFAGFFTFFYRFFLKIFRSKLILMTLLLLSVIAAVLFFSLESTRRTSHSGFETIPGHYFAHDLGTTTNDDLLMINQEDFVNVYEESKAMIVDVREDEERSLGFMPESKHIRMADILNGDALLDFSGEDIYLLCYSGSRAKDVAEYLDEKGISAKYLEGGLNEWVRLEREWIGEISFATYPGLSELNRQLNSEEVNQLVMDSALLVDARPLESYEWWNVAGSVSLPVLYTSANYLPKMLEKVDESREVVLLCDASQRSCFSALIAAMKLEERGNKVHGILSDLRAYR